MICSQNVVTDQQYEAEPGGRAGDLWESDLHVFDSIKRSWTDLTDISGGQGPSARAYHGFTGTGRRLYLFGGSFGLGEDILFPDEEFLFFADR